MVAGCNKTASFLKKKQQNILSSQFDKITINNCTFIIKKYGWYLFVLKHTNDYVIDYY